MYKNSLVKVTGYIGSLDFNKYCATQYEVYCAVNELRRMGCMNIEYNFNLVDNLPEK